MSIAIFLITTKYVSEEKMLSITIHDRLTVKSNLKNICKKANQKLNAIVRITSFTASFVSLIFLLNLNIHMSSNLDIYFKKTK